MKKRTKTNIYLLGGEGVAVKANVRLTIFESVSNIEGKGALH